MNNLTVIEHNGIRVLTTQQLAEVYETDVNNIQKNFSNNRDRFAAGRDYYLLQGDELNEFKRVLNNIQEPMKFVSQLMLWTERGSKLWRDNKIARREGRGWRIDWDRYRKVVWGEK